MTRANSTTRAKPNKPYAEFPLFAHATGRWAKKIRGRLYYFGPWIDPDAALTKYQEQKSALHAGRRPRLDPESVTLKDVANAFLNHKRALMETGELSPRTWAEYKATTDLLTKEFGTNRIVSDLQPDDFAILRNRMAKKWGPHRLAKIIQYVRSVFKHGYESGLIDRPMRFGPGFSRPTKKTIRLHKAKQDVKLFTAAEIRALIHSAGIQLKAMILLGINCAFGNADCGNLPLSAIDMERGWITYPRPKTGINRRCPLWPETVAALKAALAHRKAPKDAVDSGLVFITKYGMGWAKDTSANPITHQTSKLLKSQGINGHRNFYCLRHTFRTVADEAKDQPAAHHIMGHESPHMSSVYRERISNQRLGAVANYVRAWLYG